MLIKELKVGFNFFDAASWTSILGRHPHARDGGSESHERMIAAASSFCHSPRDWGGGSGVGSPPFLQGFDQLCNMAVAPRFLFATQSLRR
jgi:hypothetical protein